MRLSGTSARLSGAPVVALLLGLLAAGPLPAAGNNDAGDVASVRRRLREAARIMTGIFRGCRDTCCSHREEDRARDLLGGAEAEAVARRSLLALLATPLDPEVEGLALGWLSRVGDATDLPLFEARLRDSRRAWFRSGTPPPQAVGGCNPITAWTAVPVGDTALDGIRTLARGDFSNRDEYGRWRREHPNVLDAPSYWDGKVPAQATSPDCAEQVAALVRRDPRLLLALAARREGRHQPEGEGCPTLAQVRVAFPAGGERDGLLDYLAQPRRWLAAEPERSAVVTWLLEHAPVLLLPKDANAVEALLSAPQLASDHHRGLLVLAAIALDPSRGVRLLSAWADKLASPPDGFFTEGAATFPEDPRIVGWLRPELVGRCVDEPRPRAVLAGLARTEQQARKAMAGILADPKAQLGERPKFVALLAETALAVGGPQDLRACARELHDRRCGKLRQEQVEQAEAAIARALPRCIGLLKAWLRP
jgi:hypothetical protein